MENQLTVVSNAKLAEDGKQINEDVTATLNQENAQTATAAGSFPFAQNASLTDNPQLLDPQVQLQRITVDLNSVPLPALPSVGPATLAPANDAFTRYWNDSVDQLTNGVSPKLAGAFDQMLASNTSSGNSDIAFSGAPDPWAIAGMANPIAGLESLANGVQSGVNDILNSSVVQDAIGGVKSDVNMLVAGTAGLLTRVFTQPEDPMLAATDPQAYEDAQLTSQRLTGQVVSALSWDPSNPEQLRGYDAATKAQTVASLLLGGYGLVDAGFSALTSTTIGEIGSSLRQGFSQAADALPSLSPASLGGAPLRAQLGILDLSLPADGAAPSMLESGGSQRVIPSAGLTQLKATLQGVTDQAFADLTANPGLAQSLMSPGSYDQLVNGTNLAPASFGKAVERLTAQYVQSDPLLSSQFEYLSKPFVSTPDFSGTINGNTYTFDVTTDASITNHLTRSYGPTTTYITYPGFPHGLVFPQ